MSSAHNPEVVPLFPLLYLTSDRYEKFDSTWATIRS